MINRELAKIFSEMALLLELEEVEWKPGAYRNAVDGIENVGDIKKIYEEKGRKGLLEIPGVGEGIAKKIEEYIKTGKIRRHEELLEKYPRKFLDLMNVEGLGAKKIKKFVKTLGIKSASDLEKAAIHGKIRKIEGFGEKTEKNIIDALELHKKSGKRMLINEAYSIAQEIISKLGKNVERIDYAGSLRRMKETIGDIDLLAVSKNSKVMDEFCKIDGVERILAKGKTKSSIRYNGIQVDLRIIPKDDYAAALLYFTGSKEHNIALRKEAIKKGYKLSEYGLMKGVMEIKCENEKEIYEKLGFSFIEPELRENRGELELARKGEIPKLIDEKDIQGDLHMHTQYSDGRNSIQEMIKGAEDRGYKYIAITDHSPSARIARGLDEKRLEKQWKEIDKIGGKYKIRVLKGAEVNILKDGKLDYPEKVLKKFDIVIGSIHSSFKMPKREMTLRILKALKNPYLDILGHPTGRLIGTRQGYEADFEKIFKAAGKLRKVLEISSQPERLDLNDEMIILAKKYNVKFCVNTDAHSVSSLNFMRFGVGQARRGMLEKKDVVNTFSFSELKRVFKRIH